MARQAASMLTTKHPTYLKARADLLLSDEVDSITASILLGVVERTMRLWVEQGKIQGTQRGGRWYFKSELIRERMGIDG